MFTAKQKECTRHGKRHSRSVTVPFVFASFATLCAVLLTSANAQNAQSVPQTSAYECTQVALEDIDPSLLTKQERIALLDGSLSESIDSYSTCVGAVQQNMGNGAGNGGAGGDGASGDGAGGNLSGDSANEMPTENNNQGAPQQESPPPIDDSTKQENITPTQRDVIAPKDNDKIICKLLFQEIQKINDPDMLAGLKEQYSNYKCG